MSKFGFVEIPVTDLYDSIRFYSAMFNWKFNPLPSGRYAYFHTGGEIHGALSGDDQPGQGVIVYLEVPDIEAKLEEIKFSGGRIVTPKTLITKDEGYYARFADPSGNVLGLWSKN
jgi:hypothetical protein